MSSEARPAGKPPLQRGVSMMKGIRRLTVLLAVCALCLCGAWTGSAERVVEFDMMEPDHWSGETHDIIKYSYEDGVHTFSRKGLLDGGAQVVYFSPEYHKNWLLSYDFELDGELLYIGIIHVTVGDNVDSPERMFLNGKPEIQLAEKMAAVAGIEPIVHESDNGDTTYLPGGHYKGVIDVSDLIPDGFKYLQHAYIGFTGKKVTVRDFSFVSGVEASPTVIPTTTTKATTTTSAVATATTTESKADAAATTAANGTTAATAAANDAPSSLSVGAIVGIAAAAVVILGGAAVGIVLLRKKKK